MPMKIPIISKQVNEGKFWATESILNQFSFIIAKFKKFPIYPLSAQEILKRTYY